MAFSCLQEKSDEETVCKFLWLAGIQAHTFQVLAVYEFIIGLSTWPQVNREIVLSLGLVVQNKFNMSFHEDFLSQTKREGKAAK